MDRHPTTDWINGTDQRPPPLLVLVVVVAALVALVDLFLMINGG